jgi:cytochrome P450
VTNNTSIADFDLITTKRYAEQGYPHEEWKLMRETKPIHYFGDSEIPYWAITKHAHITEIGRQPDLFLSAPRLVVNPVMAEAEESMAASGFARPKTLIELDNPMHRVNRKLISSYFTPRALKKMHGDFDRISRKVVDDFLLEDGEVDFVEKVSAPLPIAVIAYILGVPESDWNSIFEWTNQMIGVEDPEYQNEDGSDKAMTDLFGYFAEMIEDRKKNPKDDLVSILVQSEIDGKKIELLDLLAWCQIIVVAGNETTRNATSGGMLALIQHPHELQRLRENPELLPSAIEEFVRWSSPIIHFARTAARDVDFHGAKIREGDTLSLFYPSANRDADVFDDPDTFRIDRSPNPHVGYGVGEHFCAGAHVARLELKLAFEYLIPRLEEIEVTGPISRLHSNLVGGIKHLPVRFKARKA